MQFVGPSFNMQTWIQPEFLNRDYALQSCSANVFQCFQLPNVLNSQMFPVPKCFPSLQCLALHKLVLQTPQTVCSKLLLLCALIQHCKWNLDGVKICSNPRQFLCHLDLGWANIMLNFCKLLFPKPSVGILLEHVCWMLDFDTFFRFTFNCFLALYEINLMAVD